MEELYPSLTTYNKNNVRDHKDMNAHVCNLLLFLGLITLLHFIFVKEPRRTIRRVPSSPILRV
jgi:hypothetical protein